MKSLFGLVVFSFATINVLNAQYLSSDRYNLGAMYARSTCSGPAVDQSSMYSQGTFNLKSNALAFFYSFNTMSHKKGLSIGSVFNMALGGSMDHYMRKDIGPGNSDQDGVWGKDFGLFVDWKIGFGINYCLPEKKTNFGVRYFNWYQSNPFGGSYSNADDAAAIGLAFNWNKLGFTYSYGSKKIPGVLINAHAWNTSEIEAKYQLKFVEKTSGGVIIGARYHTQTLLESASLTTPDTKGHQLSLFIVVH